MPVIVDNDSNKVNRIDIINSSNDHIKSHESRYITKADDDYFLKSL